MPNSSARECINSLFRPPTVEPTLALVSLRRFGQGLQYCEPLLLGIQMDVNRLLRLLYHDRF